MDFLLHSPPSTPQVLFGLFATHEIEVQRIIGRISITKYISRVQMGCVTEDTVLYCDWIPLLEYHLIRHASGSKLVFFQQTNQNKYSPQHLSDEMLPAISITGLFNQMLEGLFRLWFLLWCCKLLSHNCEIQLQKNLDFLYIAFLKCGQLI